MRYCELYVPLPLEGGFTYKIPEEMDITLGMRVVVPFGSRSLTGFVTKIFDTPPDLPATIEIKEIKKSLDTEPIFGTQEIELARWIARFYLCSVGEALSAILPSAKRVSSMEIIPEREEQSQTREHTLSTEQESAIAAITTAASEVGTRGNYFYLSGVTGSGKTEVFLRSAAHFLEQGMGVIYLVPEISLTHQLIREVQQQFTQGVAVLHSSLTPSQRLKEWKRIRSGKAPLVIGARSAIFAPVPNLGLVVIDEEHEHTYKSESTPRYNTRQVALYRVKKATLIMGSATPSLEAWKLMQEGKLRTLKLPYRISGGSMPSIEVLDLQYNPGAISPQLYEEVSKVLRKGKQAILFLNRRGFSHFFSCKSCGFELICNHCSVPLTFHKQRGSLVCHYCGHQQRPITICPQCGSLDVGYSGFGTEQVEEEIQSLFPGRSIVRVDSDTVSKKGALQRVLLDFEAGKIDILLGTQMVAKGLNFPKVELVGIILADSSLRLPDFRASERTFSQIVQVAGRAGRFAEGGKVLVQTYAPNSEAIAFAVKGDMEKFYTYEMGIRKLLGFPPFRRMARIVFRSINRALAEKESTRAAQLLTELQERTNAPITLLGPAEAPLAKIAKNWRFQIIITAEDGKYVRQGAYLVKETIRTRGVYVEVDIDPLSMM